MDPGYIVILALLAVSAWFAIRRRYGLITGTLIVWLLPVAIRMFLIWAGDGSYGGFGLGVHLVTGGLFGFIWCGLIRMVFLRFYPACVINRPGPEPESESFQP